MDLAGIQTRASHVECRRASAVEVASREFDRLFRHHSAEIGRFLAQIVSSPSQAEELMQETYLVAWRNRDQLDSVENPRAWLFSVARHQALVALRRRGRARRALRRLASEPIGEVADPADAVAVRDFLAKRLSVEDRSLLVLRYVHGFDSKELAQISNCSSEAVRQRLSRARRRIAPYLSDALQEHQDSRQHDSED